VEDVVLPETTALTILDIGEAGKPFLDSVHVEVPASAIEDPAARRWGSAAPAAGEGAFIRG
jgi:hypothetical protein